MNSSPVMNPMGGPQLLVDKMLGNAYEVVKRVYCHLDAVLHVSANLELIYNQANLPINPLAVASGVTLPNPNQTYSPDTSTAAVTLYLDDLGKFDEGAWFEVGDPMGNAHVNNITVVAWTGDATHAAQQISNHGVAEAQDVISNANTVTRYTKRNGLWRVMQYGG